MRVTFTLLILALIPLQVGCPSLGANANRAGTTGGLLGAATGAVLADDNPLGGALVGGTIGAMTGAAIGDTIDADIEHQWPTTIKQKVGVPRLVALTRLPIDTVELEQLRRRIKNRGDGRI